MVAAKLTVIRLAFISLTPQTPYDVGASAPVDESAGAGAPATEIEITPEMIEAGGTCPRLLGPLMWAIRGRSGG
jgi:hypothetical protein